MKADIDGLSSQDGQQNVNARHGSDKVKRCKDKEVTRSRTPFGSKLKMQKGPLPARNRHEGAALP
jgi:hypothetical protein